MTDVLSGLDSLFLHLETPRTPMHGASIAIFEPGELTGPGGCVPIEKLRAHVSGRLARAPKLRQRVRRAPLGLLSPQWEDDPAFDIANHVRRGAVPRPGGERELLEVGAEILSWQLDLAHPLWELWFLEGLAGGQVAVLEKFHHAMADGLAGTRLALALLDTSPYPPEEDGQSSGWQPPAPRSLGDVTADELAGLGRELLHLLGAGATSVRHPGRALGAVARAADGLRTLTRPSAVAPHTSLNAPVGLRRRLAVVRQPLDALNAAAHERHTTVNDLLLVAVALGVRRLLLARGERPTEVQVLVPVGAPHAGPADLGNRVSALLVRLPLHTDDPEEVLARVEGQVQLAWDHHQDTAASLLSGALDVLPQPAIEVAGRIVQHQPFANMVVTNVPGPQVPLYAMGSRMVEVIPVVPIAANLSVGVAAFSYHHQLTVGIVADRDRCPDVEVMAAAMQACFAALTAGVAPEDAAAASGTPPARLAAIDPGDGVVAVR
jgi:diacylglycerol O-acyltransferase